ncbi:MAG TPA: hypothetical protein VKU90_16730 [Caulobacteraceae bacterium]|nr:hypothetical protein [Caulobacteraceae bacterium]
MKRRSLLIALLVSALGVVSGSSGAQPAGAGSAIGLQLVGVYDNGSHFTAVIAVRNSTSQPVGIAAYSSMPFTSEVYLRDGYGGDCQDESNGQPQGSLRRINDMGVGYAGNYQFTAPGSTSRQTVYFWKGNCNGRITGGTDVSVDADLLIFFGGQVEHQNMSWTGKSIIVP